jgi:hypothetical protein
MPTLSDNLKSRWLPSYDAHSGAIRRHFEQALKLIGSVDAKRTELAGNKSLSDIGKKEKLAEFAKGEAATLAKAARTLQTARENVNARRAALVPSVKDKTDVAGALLRREHRDVLRTTDSANMVKILGDSATPMSMLEAIFEAPELVPTIPPANKTRLVDQLLERIAGPAVASLREQDEALTLLDVSIKAGSMTLQEAAGVYEHEFPKWMKEAAPVDPKTVEAEKDAFAAESAAAGALALPLKARMTLVESLLATNSAEVLAAG